MHLTKSPHNLDGSEYKIAMSLATGCLLFIIHGSITAHSFIIHEGSFQLVKRGGFGPLESHAWKHLKNVAELQVLKTCTTINSCGTGFAP